MNSSNYPNQTQETNFAESPTSLDSKEENAETTPEEMTASQEFEKIDPLLPFAELIDSLTDYEKQRFNPETGQVLTCLLYTSPSPRDA